MDTKQIIINKINLFMNKLYSFNINPADIYWWFSLSGGKDSYSMAMAVYTWYAENNYIFQGEGIFINQWNNNIIYTYLSNHITWMPITIIDGINKTIQYTEYCDGMQAPCSKCSKVRKDLGDQYIIEHHKQGYYNFIARGLHLSDMAISYLWRNFWNIDTISFANKLEKGKAIEKLNTKKEIYLAKPLCYVREYECEQFAKLHKYAPICCGCPACRYPSRRDIVEESLKLFFESDLWEFDIYGIKNYLDNLAPGIDIRKISLKGKEIKCNHLPHDFAEYAFNYWKMHEKYIKINYDYTDYMDVIGIQFLLNRKQYYSDKLLLPKFYSNENTDYKEKMMIATVGPFWGGVGYSSDKTRKNILDIQNRKFGITVDQNWSQVNIILQSYYRASQNHGEKEALKHCCT